MKIFKILLSLIVISFASCTITQEFSFNKDFSGNTKLSIDMSSLMEMMAGMDSTGTQTQSMKDSLDLVFKESVNKLDSMGIKNIKYGWEEGTKILFVSYDFKDIETLNNSLNASNEGNAAFGQAISKEPHVYFTKTKKTLSYKGIKSANDLGSSPDMESMKDYYKYSLIFNFAKPIKKMDNPNASISADNKNVVLTGSMFEILKNDYNSDFNFKLK